jgi:AcrR family transcriptional regulator
MNEIQEERVRGYFVSAAKDLIRSEGLVVVSARNVAERAGYSYATLYNYFKDIRDLIFSCVEDFLDECRAFVVEYASKVPNGEEHLLLVTCGYCNFFIQYPGIFDLLFHQKVSTISTPQSQLGKIADFLTELTADDWRVIEGQSSGKDVTGTVKRAHFYAIHGLLLLYLNNRQVMNYSQIMQNVKELTERAVHGH